MNRDQGWQSEISEEMLDRAYWEWLGYTAFDWEEHPRAALKAILSCALFGSDCTSRQASPDPRIASQEIDDE